MNGVSEAQLFPYAMALVSGLFGCLVAVIGWIGSQIKREIKELGIKIEATNGTLGKIERDLRGELVSLDRRITRVEEHCAVVHNGQD